MTTVAAKDLSVTRGDRHLLCGVTLAAQGGELLGIIGPNGAGKTTLLRALAGLEAPAAGTVEIDGASLSALSPRKRGQTIAYLAQLDTLAWPLETTALAALGRIPHRASFAPETPADRAAIARALAKCDAQMFAGRAVTTLSAGERARVLLARALAVEAPILLADEPIAALDPFHQLAVMGTLKREAEAGAAVIVVLHDLSLAARFCDRLALIHQGGLAALGTPADILNGDRLSAVFGTQFYRGMHEGREFVLPWAPL